MLLTHRGEAGPFARVAGGGHSFRIDINRADRIALEALPGIGSVLAERILAYRSAHGPFKDPGGLEAVFGIGPRRVRLLTPYITAGGAGGSVGALDDEIGGGDESRVDGR